MMRLKFENRLLMELRNSIKWKPPTFGSFLCLLHCFLKNASLWKVKKPHRASQETSDKIDRQREYDCGVLLRWYWVQRLQNMVNRRYFGKKILGILVEVWFIWWRPVDIAAAMLRTTLRWHHSPVQHDQVDWPTQLTLITWICQFCQICVPWQMPVWNMKEHSREIC